MYLQMLLRRDLYALRTEYDSEATLLCAEWTASRMLEWAACAVVAVGNG
jgi:hypothetical protein